MKWRRDTPYPRPKSGEKRTRIQFAWLPTDIGDHTVWLEFYFIEEVWRDSGERDSTTWPGSVVIYTKSCWSKHRVFAQRNT